MIILNGCGENNSQSVTSNNTKVTKEDTGRANMTDLSAITTVEELEEYITNDVEDTLNKLKTDQEKLTSEINTYEKYVDNVTKVEAYYNETLEETNQLGIRLREYSLKYAQVVLDMQNGYDEKYDELDGIYDCIYEDAGDDMYDIYDVILQNLYDTYLLPPFLCFYSREIPAAGGFFPPAPFFRRTRKICGCRFSDVLSIL